MLCDVVLGLLVCLCLASPAWLAWDMRFKGSETTLEDALHGYYMCILATKRVFDALFHIECLSVRFKLGAACVRGIMHLHSVSKVRGLFFKYDLTTKFGCVFETFHYFIKGQK